MAQNTQALLPVRHYNRADCTALRAYLSKITLDQIARLYYTEDDLERLGITSSQGLLAYLHAMRDDLIERVMDGNPALAHSLQHAREKFVWSKTAVDYLIHAADADTSARGADTVSKWFRPKVARRLKEESVSTLDDLIDYIEARGRNWYLPVPGLGAGRAQVIIHWLGRQRNLRKIDPDALKPPVPRTDMVVIEPGEMAFVPLERISVPREISGSMGANRYTGLCLIRANTDLQAIDAYLLRFFQRPKTLRAYTKEIERFYFWLIVVRRTPLAECLYDDCIAYVQFLANIPKDWQAPRAPRGSKKWRPFAGQLSAKSQNYALLCLKMFFNWLVGVRYLGADPWLTVPKFNLQQEKTPIQVDKALPTDLWVKLATEGGILDRLCALSPEELRERYSLRGWMASTDLGVQFRAARAMLLLMGNAGLRREEVAGALRNRLTPCADFPGHYDLDVLGKRNKWRLVILQPHTIDALRAHWVDRGLPEDIELPLTDPVHLVAPILSGPTGAKTESQYTPGGVYKLVSSTLARIADDETNDLTPHERALLRTKAPHAFRHTFGRICAENDMHLDVLQGLLGHRSVSTTTIYVQAEDKRKRSEVVKAMAKLQKKLTQEKNGGDGTEP